MTLGGIDRAQTSSGSSKHKDSNKFHWLRCDRRVQASEENQDRFKNPGEFQPVVGDWVGTPLAILNSLWSWVDNEKEDASEAEPQAIFSKPNQRWSNGELISVVDLVNRGP